MIATFFRLERICIHEAFLAKSYGGRNDNRSKTSYTLVFMALCGDLEAAGNHRRNDRQAVGHDPWHHPDACRRARQLDDHRRDRRHAAGDRVIPAVHPMNFLK